MKAMLCWYVINIYSFFKTFNFKSSRDYNTMNLYAGEKKNCLSLVVKAAYLSHIYTLQVKDI